MIVSIFQDLIFTEFNGSDYQISYTILPEKQIFRERHEIRIPLVTYFWFKGFRKDLDLRRLCLVINHIIFGLTSYQKSGNRDIKRKCTE